MNDMSIENKSTSNFSEEAITRFNTVNEKCHATLKENKIKFVSETDIYKDGEAMTEDITMYIGSFEVCIMIECSEEEVIVTFYDNGDNSAYEECEEIIDPSEWDPSGSIQGLIDFVKQKLKTEAKIASLIEKIEELCEESQLNVEDYIIVTKSFD